MENKRNQSYHSNFPPLFSKLYVTILMPIQLYQFRQNWEKIEELRKNLPNSNKKTWTQFPKCSFCEKCIHPDSFCYFCGYRNSNSTTSYEYKEACKKIESELLAQDGFNRIAEMIMENTYLPIVQLFIGLPPLLRNVSSLTSSAPNYSDVGLVLFSVGTSILSLTLGITSLYFSQGKKSALAKHHATKLLYTVSMIFQITSRIISFCMFGLIFFDKGELALLWMVLACLIHVLIIFLLRSILWILDERVRIKERKKEKADRSDIIHDIIYLISGSLLSVFVFVKGRRTSENKKDLRKKRESQESKLWSRIIFFVIVIIEQGSMYVGIIYGCNTKNIEFEWRLFIIIMSVVLALGLCLEIIIHIFFNPVAEDRDYFKEKKFTFLGTIGIFLFVSMLVAIGYFAIWLLWTVIPIVGVLIVMILVLKCNTKGQKTTFKFKLEDNKVNFVYRY